ncbi:MULTISPECIES: GbsR/MarR family transcriptional regulator [unclassified Sporosarcina]|uniref:GbsR/MarR family transcriptional regulator n=1 Tax=unclassified Sporosarcina TaxID=2647733 RepID=UPI00203D38B1|nr:MULTISPECIES: GbsR/MarR family transcriptional regulator [unclassified Sporosarcina]GKV65586.1 HTH-type transcriptional repressor OpcR [Sporosarcina sp. NCCP-2331]GLB55711.1 HTH-type transcriptional repressor OpcR [Sporosarcina sp. NCCP-2378]
MDKNDKINLIKNRIIEQVAENVKSYGHAGTIGKVMAIIHYEGKPMNLDELSEKTGMSKTRMSQVLRQMSDLNIAEKIFVKGSRKDTYIVEEDYYQTFISLLLNNWFTLVERNVHIENRLLRDLAQILDDESSSEDEKQTAQKLYDDSKESLQYFDWIRRLALLFESKEIFKYVPIIEDENKE